MMLSEMTIAKLQLCFFSAKAGNEESLEEYFKFRFSYRQDQRVLIHITWAGRCRKARGSRSSGEQPMDLRHFLTTLPPLQGKSLPSIRAGSR